MILDIHVISMSITHSSFPPFFENPTPSPHVLAEVLPGIVVAGVVGMKSLYGNHLQLMRLLKERKEELTVMMVAEFWNKEERKTGW